MQPFKLTLCVLLLSCVGCQELALLRSQSPDKDKDKKEDIEVEEKETKTDLVGTFATISGNGLITLQGVGLVTGLAGTGEDPPPSMYRTALYQEMKKNDVAEPNKILQSTNSAMVLITAYLTADIQKGDHFDVEVRLPPNSEAESLAGGWLMPTRLSEKAIIPGEGEMKGHEFGKVEGPILISTGEGDRASLAGVLKRGRILGGGVASKNRTLGLYLRSDFRSIRNSRRIADRIGTRFSYYDKGRRRPMAEAKTDQYIELKVHPRYKENYPRYMQIVRNIAFRETPVQQRDRMEKLGIKLENPEKAALASIQLEAIGNDSKPILKKALSNSHPLVRFYAAESLAYLGEEAAAEELAAAAKNEPAFRVYALAALTALDENICFQLLRDLLSQTSAETRYGAFRALWTLDKDDPFIKGKLLNDQFTLHILDTQGEPMIHLTRKRRAEVVLFGPDQRFRTPLSLTAGRININAPAGSDTITVSRFEVGRPDQRHIVSTKVSDVILAVAEMGASYPDVAQMLSQAARQFNAPGRISIDALPQAGRLYYGPVAEGGSGKKLKGRAIGKKGMMPNLFPAVDSDTSPEPTDPAKKKQKKSTKSEEKPAKDTEESGEASLTDIRETKPETTTEKDSAPKSKGRLFGFSKKNEDDSAAPPDSKNNEDADVKSTDSDTESGKKDAPRDAF